MSGERVYLFDPLLGDVAWWTVNCRRCRLAKCVCALENAMIVAAGSDGTVPADIAAQLGYQPDKPLGPCPERKQT